MPAPVDHDANIEQLAKALAAELRIVAQSLHGKAALDAISDIRIVSRIGADAKARRLGWTRAAG